jgi:hypothetical protein
VIETEQTTHPITTNDGTGSYQVIPCPADQGIPQALMIPPTKRLLVEHEHVLEVLAGRYPQTSPRWA